ncbi:MAG: BrnT family toxin [Terracidiphilus sp.]
MEITFDPRKSERNLRERGFGFEIASGFDLSSAIYAIDTRKDYGEVRIRTLGLIGDTLYALVFTMRDGVLRVISLRKASRKERNRYEKARF